MAKSYGGFCGSVGVNGCGDRMGWFEKQETPLGRTGFVGYAGRFVLLQIGGLIFLGVAGWAVVKLITTIL